MSRKVVSLQPVCNVRTVMRVLRISNHDCFPLTWDREPLEVAAEGSEAPFELVGVVERSTILRMLKHRVGVFRSPPVHSPRWEDVPLQLPETQEEREKINELLEQYPLKVRHVGGASAAGRGRGRPLGSSDRSRPGNLLSPLQARTRSGLDHPRLLLARPGDPLHRL